MDRRGEIRDGEKQRDEARDLAPFPHQNPSVECSV